MNHFKGRVLLADEMGVGKTIQALWYLKIHPTYRPAIVICPAHIKYVWRDQAKEHIGMRATILNTRTPPKRGFLDKDRELVIINYDVLEYWMHWLKRMKASVLILDESHYMKSRTALRIENIRELGRKIPHVLCISGTPNINGPQDLWTTLNLLQPNLFPSFLPYAQRYCDPKLKSYGWEYKGATNTRELYRMLKQTCMIRRLKKDVLPELPPKVRTVVPLDIERRGEYEEALTDFLSWLEKKDKSKVKKASKAKELVKVGYIKRLVAELKMKEALKWIDNFLETNEKLVVFCIHKHIAQILTKKYKKISVVVVGTTNQEKRYERIQRFQKKKKCRMMIGNIKAAGTGIDLTAAFSVAFLELPWVPGLLLQAEDRVNRWPQKETCFIYYLVAKGTVEEKLCQILQKKHDDASKALDGTIEHSRLDIYNILLRQLKGKR